MIFQRIESEGLAHNSYLIADGRDAAVIDPRFDCDVYVEQAHFAGFRVRHIFETHRHEDFILGSATLAEKTGAAIWHADSQWAYEYGQAAQHKQKWSIGRLTIEALSSPGHTPGSMSYLLHDPSGKPWVVFTGDALFAGDVGRVDFMGMDEAPPNGRSAVRHNLWDTSPPGRRGYRLPRPRCRIRMRKRHRGAYVDNHWSGASS